MLLYGATSTRCSMICPRGGQTQLLTRKAPIFLASTRISVGHPIAAAVVAAAAAALVLSAGAIEVAAPTQPEETLSNIPQTLSSICTPEQDCKKSYKIQRPKSRKAENCTRKCVTTCIQSPEETLSNIPQTLSSICTPEQDCKKSYKIQRPKSRKAENCTRKCVTTCIQGGFGSPGEGPFNIRRPLVVFKDDFRSRKYCLSECSDICNLIGDGDDGP